ncbi:hypothetical protein CCAX7_006660 [Capsulimonas corticalis]|uniref:Uncharacterized protein n=1 Tax=Capsulimonas corticalis TaxID=2219043 RepID=A0A402D1F2_9BACT|nr:hypothetical protein [Capsulimonas corticalis]BDI28615.1 hypothetical protein CCAX7_006660 [Capsulimonas corticalis]
MSVTHNGQRLTCDGPGCMATANVLVALRSLLNGVAPSSVSGWLHVVREERWMHYCPACERWYLASLAESDRIHS